MFFVSFTARLLILWSVAGWLGYFGGHVCVALMHATGLVR